MGKGSEITVEVRKRGSSHWVAGDRAVQWAISGSFSLRRDNK